MWQVNPKVGNEEVSHRLQKVFDKLTEKGRMIKREISMNGVTVNMNRVPMPQQCKDDMAKVENMYADQKMKGVVYLQQRRLQESYKVPAATNMAVNSLKEGKQVVIFADRVNDTTIENKKVPSLGKVDMPSTINSLKESLIAKGVKPEDIVEIHGGVTKAQQKIGMSKFQTGHAKVCIATIASGGTGINLDDRKGNAPRNVIIMTAPLSPVDNVQAAGRVWRATTKSNPELNYIFGDTPIDNWNSNLIASKMGTLHAVVNGQVGKLDLPHELSDEGVAELLSKQEHLEKTGKTEPTGHTDWEPTWLHGDKIGWREDEKKAKLPPPPKPKPLKTPKHDHEKQHNEATVGLAEAMEWELPVPFLMLANDKHDEKGRFAESDGTASSPVTRVARALQTYKPSTKEKQDLGDTRQRDVAKMLGFKVSEDNKPMDVLGENKFGKHTAIEVKTLCDQKNSKLTMHPDARERKLKYGRKNKANLFTIAVDDRDTFNGGQHKDLYSGNKFYIRKGVGSFEIKTMTPVSKAELKAIVRGDKKL